MIIMKLEENKNNTHEICRCHLDCQIYSPYEGALRARLYVKFVDAVRLKDWCNLYICLRDFNILILK